MHVQLDWLSQLPSLRSVDLWLQVPLVTLPESISQLTQLTNLRLCNYDSGNKIKVSCLWSSLVALQEFSLTGVVQFDEDLCDLVQVVPLTSVYIENMDDGTGMVCQVEQLRQKLAATRPNVTFTLGYT